MSPENAQRELVKLENSNTIAEIEKSFWKGEKTRAEVEGIYKKIGIK